MRPCFHASLVVGLLGVSFATAQPSTRSDPPEVVLAKAKQALARLDGELKLPGLKEPVEVFERALREIAAAKQD